MHLFLLIVHHYLRITINWQHGKCHFVSEIEKHTLGTTALFVTIVIELVSLMFFVTCVFALALRKPSTCSAVRMSPLARVTSAGRTRADTDRHSAWATAASRDDNLPAAILPTDTIRDTGLEVYSLTINLIVKQALSYKEKQNKK